MVRTASEEKVLKALGITDFRHMTKDKVMKFASMVPKMDPEVAKKAIEQFPAFKDMMVHMVSEYRVIIEKTLQENSKSQDAFYQECHYTLETLREELQKETLSVDERNHIEEQIISILTKMEEKDSENKRLLMAVNLVKGVVIVVALGIAGSLLGVNTKISNGDTDALDSSDVNKRQST